MRVDCIRVTHPYATLGPLLLKILPFSLHVLGLPLAFILSQDQTLHSINPSSHTSSRIYLAAHSVIPMRTISISSGLIFFYTLISEDPLALLPTHLVLELTRPYPLSSMNGSAINLIYSKNVRLRRFQQKNCLPPRVLVTSIRNQNLQPRPTPQERPFSKRECKDNRQDHIHNERNPSFFRPTGYFLKRWMVSVRSGPVEIKEIGTPSRVSRKLT